MARDIIQTIEFLRDSFSDIDSGVLSVYADINPAKPENAGKAWVKRVKNTIKDLPEIHYRGKRDSALYDQVMNLLDMERPQARTLALFAARGLHDRLITERVDLQVELPVIDVAQGRVDARWGKPYLTPLLFAADEYEMAGVLHLTGARWRFYKVYLGELIEDESLFEEITEDEWKELSKLARFIEETTAQRRAVKNGRFNKLSPKEREAAKVSVWMHKLYGRLARMLDKAVARSNVNRLVLMGEDWQLRHFEGYLSKSLRSRIVGRTPHPANPSDPNPNDIMERVEPILVSAEREAEMKILKDIEDQPGLWGLDPVLDALQMGRVDVWVLPWSIDAQIWMCTKEGAVAGTEETARLFCDNPVQVPLRDHVWDLAQEFGSRIEFVRGEAENYLLEKLQGTAALLRW